MTGAILTIY